MATRTETKTDLAAGEQGQQDKGLLGRLKGTIVGTAADRGWVEIDGQTMTSAAGRLVRERSMQYLGADLTMMARKTSAGRTVEEPFDPREHSAQSGWSKRLRLREFLRLEEGDRGLLANGEKGPPQIHLVANGRYVGAIGQTLARNVLIRIGAVQDDNEPKGG